MKKKVAPRVVVVVCILVLRSLLSLKWHVSHQVRHPLWPPSSTSRSPPLASFVVLRSKNQKGKNLKGENKLERTAVLCALMCGRAACCLLPPAAHYRYPISSSDFTSGLPRSPAP